MLLKEVHKMLSQYLKQCGVSCVLICTPFTGQTSGRGIIMRYSYEFRLYVKYGA